jgi:hypothetical protein
VPAAFIGPPPGLESILIESQKTVHPTSSDEFEAKKNDGLELSALHHEQMYCHTDQSYSPEPQYFVKADGFEHDGSADSSSAFDAMRSSIKGESQHTIKFKTQDSEMAINT